jgi:mannose-6-phosphate isomerase-like protein (cupin superfamily)
MAKTNQVISNPVIGDKCTFLITSEDSNGEAMRGELRCPGGITGTPLHYHPVQSEYFEVIAGQMKVHCNGKDMVLSAGQTYMVPANAVHNWTNASKTEELHAIVELKPALKTEFFLETMYELAQQGKVKPDALPKSTLQFAAILHEYYGELFIEGPPIIAQKFMAKVVGGFAKMLGYKGYIPYGKN